MGLSDSKSISEKIEERFKSLRKFHDPFYGQITLVKERQSSKLYALIQKVIISQSLQKTQEFILQRSVNPGPYFLEMREAYRCCVDYCSGLEKYFFLLEYTNYTLYDELTIRHEKGENFTLPELLTLFTCYLNVAVCLVQAEQKFLFSNHHLAYFSVKELKALETILKSTVEDEFLQKVQTQIENKQSVEYYVSPETFKALCECNQLEAKRLHNTEQSIVFMLGVNFIECILLSDISDIYDCYSRRTNDKKLQEMLKQVEQTMGPFFADLLRQMVKDHPSQRLKLRDLIRLLEKEKSRRKFLLPISEKQAIGTHKKSIV